MYLQCAGFTTDPEVPSQNGAVGSWQCKCASREAIVSQFQVGKYSDTIPGLKAIIVLQFQVGNYCDTILGRKLL